MLDPSPVYRNLQRRHGFFGLELMDWFIYGVFLGLMFFFVTGILFRLGLSLAVLLAWRRFKKGKRAGYTLHYLGYYLKPRIFSPLERERKGRAYRPE